ncbi:IclR family transcriptional regulator domain-containing protein [Acinetobacter silvestris]|uniref:IclR family transcriptional regulator n=1 Tax=Acinetobacter silvestris TaxID=1977882 RepID=A0A1Y3C5W9_9GAMM|nr:IclR family transcriptional regulator C-terminal domain-containing protein [Acinetobacter silvestris]OTG62417.1 IclR family transcriptional regulator [Acinetobacter silvestris]
MNSYLKSMDTNELIKEDDYIISFAKGLSLLEAFGVERQKLNVTQIAEKTQLSRTAARRYLRTLKFLGYLDSDEHFYWLTHKVLRFSSAFLNSSHLSKIAQPILNLLCVQTTLTFSLVILDESEVVPIARSYLPQQENLRISPYGMHLGNRLPAHATSTGKVLLASLSELEQINWLERYGLKRLTSYTTTDKVIFLDLLKQISLQDYCLSSDEHELGIMALAVPVINSKGEHIAALNCIVQKNKASTEYLTNQILPLLQNTASEMRAML